MYLPKIWEETRLDVLHAMIRANPLGTWVTAETNALNVNHIPFFLDEGRGELGTLVGHVARANPIWRDQGSKIPDAITFRGPQTYVSPSWYPSKHQHGKAVPTWNYAIVTVHGQAKFIDDEQWLLAHLHQLTDEHESGQSLPWKIDDAPVDFTRKMVAAIVGVEIPILKIEGKWKTNQNRTESDRLGVVAGLLAQGDEEAKAMAALVGRPVSPPS